MKSCQRVCMKNNITSRSSTDHQKASLNTDAHAQMHARALTRTQKQPFSQIKDKTWPCYYLAPCPWSGGQEALDAVAHSRGAKRPIAMNIALTRLPIASHARVHYSLVLKHAAGPILTTLTDHRVHNNVDSTVDDLPDIWYPKKAPIWGWQTQFEDDYEWIYIYFGGGREASVSLLYDKDCSSLSQNYGYSLVWKLI